MNLEERKLKKRIISLLLCLCMVFSLLPTAVLAADGEDPDTSAGSRQVTQQNSENSDDLNDSDDSAIPAVVAEGGEGATTTAVPELKNPATSGISGGIDWKVENGTLTITPSNSPESGFARGQMVENYGTLTKEAPDDADYIAALTAAGYTPGSNGHFYYPNTKTWVSDSPWKFLSEQITSVVVKDGVTSIAARAFRLPNVTEVSIPASVTSIGNLVFEACEKLTTVNWTGHWEGHGPMAFNGFSRCSSLGDGDELTDWMQACFYVDAESDSIEGTQFTVNFDELNKRLQDETTYPRAMFRSVPKITYATLTSQLNVDYIFEYSGIQSVTIADDQTSIAEAAFRGCKDLTSVTIPASVNLIHTRAFADSGLKNITFSGLNSPTFGLFAFENVKLDSLTLKDAMSLTEAVKIIGALAKDGAITDSTEITPAKFANFNAENVVVDGAEGEAINHQSYPLVKNLTINGAYTSAAMAFGNSSWGQETLENLTIRAPGKDVTINATAFLRTPLKSVKIEAKELTFNGDAAFLNTMLLTHIDLTGVDEITLGAGGKRTFAINDTNNGNKSAPTRYVYFKDADAYTAMSSQFGGNENTYYLVTNGGSVDATKTGFDAVYCAGYTAEWYETEDFSGTPYTGTPEKGKTYYAKWIEHIPERPIIHYELVQDFNYKGTGSTTWTQTADTATDPYTFNVLTGQDGDPKRENYKFLGWADEPTATTAQYHTGDPIVLTRENPTKTIYAVWTPCNHSYGWVDNGDGTHSEKCTECGHKKDEKEDHYDNDSNGKCDACGADMPTPPTDVPELPGEKEKIAGSFYFTCETEVQHYVKTYVVALQTRNGYTILNRDQGAQKDENGYYFDLQVDATPYLSEYNTQSGKEHTICEGETNLFTIRFHYVEKVWVQDSKPTVKVECNGSQPETPPTKPGVLEGGVTFECENPDKTHTVFYSTTYTIQAKDYTFISDVRYDDETKQYYVLANVTLDSEYYLELFDGWTGATHRISDGQSLTLTGIRFNYEKSTAPGGVASWKQELPKPVITVTCAEELFPVKLVIYRNGDTSKDYKTVSLESRPKDYVIDLTEIKIGDYYTGQYDFYGWYDDGLWNIYKRDPANPPAGLTEKTVNGWTNFKCMVYDYEKVVYFQTQEALTDYQNDHSKTDGLLYTTTARKGDTLPTTDAPTATREGYTFLHWSREGQTSDVTGQTVNGWTNLYANWEKIPDPTKENIEFNGKDTVYVKCDIYGTHAESIAYDKGEYVIKRTSDTTANLVFTSASYLAASKYADDHALAAVSDPEVSTQIEFKDGKWQQLKNGPTVQVRCKVTLTYDAHAPEGKPVTNMPDPLKVTQTLDEGSATTFYLSNNIPACEGYVFLGWTSDTTLDVPTIPVEWKTENNGANWKTTTGYPGYTLYAVWQKLTPVYAYMQPMHKDTALTSKDAKITAALKDLGFEEGFNLGKKYVTIGKTETDKTDLNDVSKQVTDEIDDGTFAAYEMVHATKAVLAKIDWNELKLVDDAEHKGYKEDGKIEGYHLNGTLSFCDVQFKPNGDNVKNMPADVYHLQYTDIALATPTREGYTFKGWSVQEDKPTALDASNGAGTLVKDSFYVRNDTIFTAQWEPEIYTITYEYNDKDIKNKQHLQPQNPNSYTIEDAITLNDITAAGEHGKQFVKWRCDLNKDGVAETITEIPKGTTGNLTISAHWNYPVNYTVFDKNGDKIDRLSNTEYVFEDVLRSEEGYKLTALTQDGYTFDGWYQDDADLGKTEKLIKDQTLKTAKKWELYGKLTPNEYTVTFDPNAEGASVAPTSQLVTFDAAYGELPTPTREGYTFEGWYLSKTEFTPANKVEATTIVKTPGDHMLYANWAANTYTVTFNPNADDATVAPTSQLVTFDAAYGELPTPTRENYRFVGWYLNGVRVTKDTIVKTAANHTLLAGWSRSYYALTINYVDRNGKKLEKSYEASVALGADFSVTSPDVKGYKLRDKDDAVIEGTMTAAGYTYDVVYVKKSSGGSGVQIESPNKPKQDNSLKFNTEDHFAYVNGYPDGTVKPTGDVTRAEVAAILYRVMDADCVKTYETTRCSFSDVVRGDWFNLYVATLENADVIVDTRTNGKFRPNEAITRAELAAMLAQFADIKSAANSFNDVSARHWASDEIAVCAKMGWINGYPDGSFRPDATITRAEMMAMINRALGRTPKSADDLLSGMKTWRDNANVNAWYYLDVQEATNSHTYTKSGSHETWKKLR